MGAILHGDCIEVMRTLPDSSVDAIVTDPPYDLTAKKRGGPGVASAGGFMGKAWDSTGIAFRPDVWAECLRVLKPGGHLLAFGGTRTWHRLAVAVEDAGFEMRDSIAWLYGSGFPKSLDVSKAIDKAAGATREVVGSRTLTGTAASSSAHVGNLAGGSGVGAVKVVAITAPATPDAERWKGWGTALKPSHEPVVCARKPLSPVPLSEEVDRLHHLIGGLLWLSLSPAKRAALTSPSSPAGQHEATCVSALVSAALDTSPDASDETVTFSSPALASTSSSIASSWSATLGALSARTRTSTTSTASSTTTALRTLNLLLGPITSQTTMPRCGCLVAGPSSPAPSAASSSSGEWAKWLHTLSASVPATATEGIALAVASALASIAADLSGGQAAASSAAPTATTGAAASRNVAFEPVVVARKPLTGTVAANVLEHGTGALNIDACRVGDDVLVNPPSSAPGADNYRLQGGDGRDVENARRYAEASKALPPTTFAGRWPTNVVLDDSQAAALDEQSGESKSPKPYTRNAMGGEDFGYTVGGAAQYGSAEANYGDQGGASRFFKVISQTPSDLASTPDFPTFRYQAKAPTRERPMSAAPGRWPTNVVLDGHAADALDQQSGYQRDGVAVRRNVGKSGGNFPFGAANPDMREDVSYGGGGGASRFFPTFRYQAKAPTRERPKVDGVAHPTVKPLELMRWLVRLVTPPGGIVLDPFAGSGTTVEAAMMEGFDCIAIEREASYLPLIRARVLARIDRMLEGSL